MSERDGSDEEANGCPGSDQSEASEGAGDSESDGNSETILENLQGRDDGETLESLSESVDEDALQVVREESRHVLSEQIDLLKDLDDEAMRTVRTSVLVIGLVISAVQVSRGSISEVSSASISFQLGSSGIVLLLLSIFLGVYTYSVSDPEFGVGDSHRIDVVDGNYTESEWLLIQLNEYSEWAAQMRSLNEKNVTALHLTLFSSTAGVLVLLTAVVVEFDWGIKPLIYPIFISILSVFIFYLILCFSK
jgi:hypothetical protein